MADDIRTSDSGAWIITLAALIGCAVAIYNYNAADNGISGTPGAMLVIYSTIALIVAGFILGRDMGGRVLHVMLATAGAARNSRHRFCRLASGKQRADGADGDLPVRLAGAAVSLASRLCVILKSIQRDSSPHALSPCHCNPAARCRPTCSAQRRRNAQQGTAQNLAAFQRRPESAEILAPHPDHAGQCKKPAARLARAHRRCFDRSQRFATDKMLAGYGLVGDAAVRQRHDLSRHAVLPHLRARTRHREGEVALRHESRCWSRRPSPT